MGKLVDAGALLRAIAGSGSDMKIPNLYVGTGKTVKIDLRRYFLNGEELTYECTINDTSKAVATFEGTVMTVKAVSYTHLDVYKRQILQQLLKLIHYWVI